MKYTLVIAALIGIISFDQVQKVQALDTVSFDDDNLDEQNDDKDIEHNE